VRGAPHAHPDVKYTLKSLRLMKKNQAVLLYNNPGNIGMLNKVKDFITWGEASKEAISLLLEKRCKVPGNKRLTNKYVKERLGLASIKELAKEIYKASIPLEKLRKIGVKPSFRLHPPRGGFKRSIKRPFKSGGELGYRGEAINDLVFKMI
jgi:large subunit ribosomal protein L30